MLWNARSVDVFTLCFIYFENTCLHFWTPASCSAEDFCSEYYFKTLAVKVLILSCRSQDKTSFMLYAQIKHDLLANQSAYRSSSLSYIKVTQSCDVTSYIDLGTTTFDTGYSPYLQSSFWAPFYQINQTFSFMKREWYMWQKTNNFPVVLFVMLYKVLLTFESVDEILKCDHSNESYWAVLSCGAVCYAVQGASNLWVWDLSVTIPECQENY